jgi:hypothetical protein
MKRTAISIALGGGFLLSFCFLAILHPRADSDDGDSRVQIGLRIAPVHLNLHGLDREKVGVGSYLVNAVAGCNDCHTCPSYDPGPDGPALGHSPYGPPFGPPGGGDGKIDSAHYLAGGVLFNPPPPGFISPNLTPDPATGLPDGGHTFNQFLSLIRHGRDLEDGHILQVMPWPVFRNMSNEDLRAIYEFLRAIPPAVPGVCVAPGQ